MPNITSFEVLSQPIVPGVADVPYVTQGSFLQLTNLDTANAQKVFVGYAATPAFVASSGSIALMANYIDDTGSVTMISAQTFLANPVGFPPVIIPAGGTFIFGVQYILQSTTGEKTFGTTPQDGQGTRGLVTLTAPSGSSFAALATIRQVFNNYDSNGNLMDVSESAYSVPIIGGPVVSF